MGLKTKQKNRKTWVLRDAE